MNHITRTMLAGYIGFSIGSILQNEWAFVFAASWIMIIYFIAVKTNK